MGQRRPDPARDGAVVVSAGDAPGTSVVAAMDPVAALQLARSEAIAPLAEEVRGRRERALDAVARDAAGDAPS